MPAPRVVGRVRCLLRELGEINPQFLDPISVQFDDVHLQTHGGHRPDQPPNALDLVLEDGQSLRQRVLYLLGLLAELVCLVGPAGRLQMGRRLEQMVGLLADHLRRRGNAGRAGIVKHTVGTGDLVEQRNVQRRGYLRPGRPVRIRLLAIRDAQRSGDDTDQQDSPHSTHSLRQVFRYSRPRWAISKRVGYTRLAARSQRQFHVHDSRFNYGCLTDLGRESNPLPVGLVPRPSLRRTTKNFPSGHQHLHRVQSASERIQDESENLQRHDAHEGLIVRLAENHRRVAVALRQR